MTSNKNDKLLGIDKVADKLADPTKGTEQGRLFANEPMPEMIQVAKNYLDSSRDTEKILTDDKIQKAIQYGKFKIEEIKHEGTKKERAIGIEMLQELDAIKIGNMQPSEVSNYLAEQFVSFIKIISDPLSKKYYLALWKIAGRRGMPVFSGLKVSDLIKEATGKTTNQIRQRDRQLATKFLIAWNRIMLKVYTGITKKPHRVGKKTYFRVIRDYQYTKLINLVKGTDEEIIDDKGKIIETATIKKIYGTLPFNTQAIGGHIPEKVLLLTGDEGERIDLTLDIWIRANQLHKSRFLLANKKKTYTNPDFKDKKISWTRAEWIKHAGKVKTDKINKTRANEMLLADFARLKELEIISDYPINISSNDDEIIAIML